MKCRLGKRKSERHGADSSTAKVESSNSFTGSPQPEQLKVSAFLLDTKGVPLPPIG